MRSLIAWKTKEKKFDVVISIDYECSDAVLMNNQIEKDYKIPEEVLIFEHTELYDLSGNKIYADCSIVEFEWGQDKHNIIGYFTFNKEFLQYEIIMLNVQKNKSLAYSPHNCFNFKIIDTIQENKLGLIK